MYKTAEEHKAGILKEFNKAFNLKYDVGQIQHLGRLWAKNTQSMLEEEAIDFIAYLYTRRDQVSEATKIAEKSLFVDSEITREKFLQVYYLLQYGNKEGTLEEDRQ